MASKVDSYEQKGTTVTTRAVSGSESPHTEEEAIPRPGRNLTQAIWTIVYGVALPCIPIIVITIILLYFILHYRIELHSGWPELQPPAQQTHENATTLLHLWRQQGGNAAYYVKYNPSTITTIASWTGRIIPYLSSSIMALVAFFAARHIVLKSKNGHESDLPSPEQLTLLISLLGGSGFGPLKETLLHRFYHKKKLVSPLPVAFTALAIITVLGILIPIIDSWFGIATKAVTVTQLTQRPSSLSFGRGLSASVCPNGPRDNQSANFNLDSPDEWWPCDVTVPGHPYPYIPGLGEASRIALGLSADNKLFNYTDKSGSNYFYLGDPAQNALVDYQAKTIATRSQCVPMTQLCFFNFDAADYGHLFNCTPGFSGNFWQNVLNTSASDLDTVGSQVNVGIAFSNNPELTEVGETIGETNQNDNSTWTYNKIYTTNPIYYGSWAVGYPPPDLNPYETFANDTGIYYDPSNSGGMWVMNCSTEVYDISYTWVNGAVQTFNTSLASTDMSAFLSAPFTMANWVQFMENALSSVATIAGSANNSRLIADSFAQEFSKALLAYSIGAMEPKLNEFEQARNSSIPVARIPMVPLYLLLGTKALYVLAVIVLAIGAYCFTHPAETELVKAQLSVQGLAAAHFNQPDLVQKQAVSELQKRLDAARGRTTTSSSPPSPSPDVISEDPGEKRGLQRAATAPVGGIVELPKEAKVGLLPGIDGTWQFVVVANGVWNSIKPMVESFVVNEANNGGLGDVGGVIKAWKG